MRKAYSCLLVWAVVSQYACTKAAGSNSGSEPVAVVRAHLDAQNAHDVDRILGTLADTLELHVFGSDQRDSVMMLDRAAQRRAYEQAVRAVPQSHFTILNQIVSGPFVVSREEMRDKAAGRSEVGLAMYRIVGDRVVAIWILNTEGMRP